MRGELTEPSTCRSSWRTKKFFYGASAAVATLAAIKDPATAPCNFAGLASCPTRPNTWFYDQVLKETGGVAVTVTRRVDTFDGAAGSATSPNLRIAANGSTSVRTRWCSVSAAAHTAQTTFSGTDANGKAWTATGPLVRLSAR